MKKKCMWLLLTMILLISSLSLVSHAASLPRRTTMDEYFYVFKGMGGDGFTVFPKGTKFSAVKSSSKDLKYKVMKINQPDGKLPAIKMSTSKAGDYKLTFKAALAGKTKSYKVNVHAMEYKNPFAVLKIGKKDYAPNFKKKEWMDGLKKPVSGKLQIEAAKGFSIKEISIFGPSGEKKVKNGSKITLKAGESLHIIYFYRRYGINGGNDYIHVNPS